MFNYFYKDPDREMLSINVYNNINQNNLDHSYI